MSELTSDAYHDIHQNIKRSDFISTKHVLLETLANAAHPLSKKVFMRYAEPNFGHAGWRHGALSGVKYYLDEEV